MASPVPKRLDVSALDGYGDDEHVELIDGEIVRETMTSFEHGDAQLSTGAEVRFYFRGDGPPGGEGGWWIVTEVDVVYAETQCFRHDVVGWRKTRVPSRPVGKRVSVRPDWVCEVLSTNRNKDLVDKRRVLHAHAVPHYWVLDPDAPLLTVLRHHPEGYLIAATVAPGERARLEPFEAVEFEVSRLFGDLE
jgi:Uma2 family endonuclease